MSAPRGAVNVWTCDRCAGTLAAVHTADGVTPMMLACRATDGCRGRMVSAGYPPPPIPVRVLDAVAWEWSTASTTQIKRWRREHDPMYDHARRGGLVLRRLTDDGRTILGRFVPIQRPTSGKTATP